MARNNYWNAPTRHREIVGVESKPHGKDLKTNEIKKYVQERVKIGDLIATPRDSYNYDKAPLDDTSEKEVVEFYSHYVVTVNDFGQHETFTWFDLYTMLHAGMKVRPKPQPKKEERDEQTKRG